jgi:tRNA (guanine-N7-)-methyltransferase
MATTAEKRCLTAAPAACPIPGMSSIEATNLKRRIYGRRRGRKLRQARQALMNGVLPRLAFALSEIGALDPNALFAAPPRDIWLEIGFGAGEHLATQAAAYRDIGMLGSEVFENGIARLVTAVDAAGLNNIRLFVDDARLLLECLPDRCLGRVFILFPDPWPKERHKKRRMVAAATLDQLARLMPDGAELRLATDHAEYAEWMAALLATRRDFAELAQGSGDWPGRPADWPPTRYEEKARASGRIPRFFLYRRVG